MQKNYIKELEKFIETTISSISTSPERNDTILIKDPFKFNSLEVNFLTLRNLACAFEAFQMLYFLFV